MIFKNHQRFTREKRPKKLTSIIFIGILIVICQAYGLFYTFAKLFIYEKIPEKYIVDTQWNIGKFQLIECYMGVPH